MDTNSETKLLSKDEVYQVVGSAIEVLQLNYLKTTKLRVGVILNFKNPKLEWERIVL